jgi:glycosyltransferase involved in cell wall biosynthesis
MSSTRLVVTLLVRDEADVMAATLEFYLAQSPSRIIVTDNSSTDGTADILERYAESGHIDLIFEPNLQYRQSEWVTRMARSALHDHGADWVINADVDEFWMPVDRSRGLIEELSEVPEQFDMIQVVRDDLRALRSSSEERPWLRRLVWRDTCTVASNGNPLGLKAAHRAGPDVVVALGNHDVTGLALHSILPSRPLEILHVPLRSWQQFARKIENGGSSYEFNPEAAPQSGWHWREDYQLMKKGLLRPQVEKRLLGRRELAAGLLAGRFRRELWLRRHLTSLVGRAAHPELLTAALTHAPGRYLPTAP